MTIAKAKLFTNSYHLITSMVSDQTNKFCMAMPAYQSTSRFRKSTMYFIKFLTILLFNTILVSVGVCNLYFLNLYYNMYIFSASSDIPPVILISQKPGQISCSICRKNAKTFTKRSNLLVLTSSERRKRKHCNSKAFMNY